MLISGNYIRVDISGRRIVYQNYLYKREQPENKDSCWSVLSNDQKCSFWVQKVKVHVYFFPENIVSSKIIMYCHRISCSICYSAAFQANGNRGRLSRRQSQGMCETAMAKISLIVVFVFICCHSVKWIPNIHEIIMVRLNNI